MIKRNLIFSIIICLFCAGIVQVCIAEENNEYWTNGNIKSTKEYREDGSLDKITGYDSDGEKISEAHYDSNGNLSSGMDGWAAMRWKYNEGNISAEGYYGSNGHLKEYKEYNSEGDLINKEYLGSEDMNDAEEDNPEATGSGETVLYSDTNGDPQESVSSSTGSLGFPEEWEVEEYDR